MLAALHNALYPLTRSLLFKMDAEEAHALTLKSLSTLAATGLANLAFESVPANPKTVMGITFPNPVGLAAGADKNGECIAGFAALGFGFIELGGVTPRPQPGNPKPRMFRLPEAQAVINRLGFNNLGVDHLVANIAAWNVADRTRCMHSRPVIGVNLGKNLDTPLDKAVDDYLHCYGKVYPHVQFATINISSPNTANLRQLQNENELAPIMRAMKEAQASLADQHGRYVPLAVKIAPDLDDEQVKGIADLLVAHKMDSVIATNTTIARDKVAGLVHANEIGGLSGAPVLAASNAVISKLAQHLQGAVPIIGVGGILSGADAQSKIDAGASLVQFYTGLVYRGPALVAEVASALR